MSVADERKAKFLELVRNGETGQGAARALGLKVSYFYQHRKDAAFKAAWQAALAVNPEARKQLALERSFDNTRVKTTIPPAPGPSGTTKNTPFYHERLFAGLAQGHSITKAAEEAELSYSAIAKWRRKDKVFNAKCLEAIQQGIDRLEDEARRRAVDGYNETIYNGKGEVMSTSHRYSDQLLALMLKSKINYYRKPEGMAVNVGAGGQVTVNVVGVPSGQFLQPEDSVVLEGELADANLGMAREGEIPFEDLPDDHTEVTGDDE